MRNIRADSALRERYGHSRHEVGRGRVKSGVSKFLSSWLYLVAYIPKRDFKALAISTNITELSYNISDIQTRIFGASYTLRYELL
jgi:hypothetical protein